MQCPVCNVELKMTERQGIEIDYCSQCRGVWLDRGELDKIIERSVQMPPSPQPEPRHYREDAREHDYRRHPHDEDDYYKRRKRKSFLGELFDFD
jgi:Zn-finger nucleic acid-binding protein